MADTVETRFELRMLVGSKLFDGEAGTFTNVTRLDKRSLGRPIDQRMRKFL